MNVQNIGLANFNFKQKTQLRKCYTLCYLTKFGDYKGLTQYQRKLLYQNGLNKNKLVTLYDKLAEKIDDYHVIDHIGKYGIGLRREDFYFEIGKTCKLLLRVFFRSFIRHPMKYLVFEGDDISPEGVMNAYSKIIEEYKEMMNNPKGGTEDEFYNSNTLNLLYSPKFKVKPQQTENGYLTTIINKESGEPEKAYISIKNGRITTDFILSKDIDGKYPINEYELRLCNLQKIELAHFEFGNGNDMKSCVRGYQEPRMLEYGGVTYRIIQALIEYSLHKNTNIIIRCNGDDLPLYTKAGFRVNPEKDKFIAENNWDWEFMYKECDGFGISREEFKSALKKREKDGVTGYGEDETWETFVRLLYQKNKYCGYYFHTFHLELTPEAKQEWLERIKSQPILADKI